MEWYEQRIVDFTSKCLVCGHVKAEHQVPISLQQSLSMPKIQWERITIDLASALPRILKNHDAIWVIIDRLT